MIFLFLACATANPPTCEATLQYTDARELGTDASGYQYCWADEEARGSFDRVESVTCTGAVGECTTDADCGSGQVCVCGGARTFDDGETSRELTVLSQCVTAACAGPDDCEGEACGVALDVCGQAAAHYCRGPSDACRLDSDCSEGAYCGHDGTWWTCIASAECE